MTPDFIIVGGGFAGLATAYFLTTRKVGRVLLIEKESMPGLHSSGRSAAIVMQVPKDPVLARFSRRGMQHLDMLQSRWKGGIGLVHNGSVLIGTQADLAQYAESVADAVRAGVAAEYIDAEQCAHLVPALDPTAIEGGIHCPSDGWVDVELLIQGLAREAVATGLFTILTGTEVEEVVKADGKVVGVRTSHGRFDAPVVINAAGPWADEFARLAGAQETPLRCHRRHVFVTLPTRPEAEVWPVAWNISEGYLFRPMQGGLLMCVCDEAEMEPADYSVHSEIKRILRDKALRISPALAPPVIDHAWVGLRSVAPDHRMVIGPDPLVSGLFWVAGLGSHGVATCCAAGELAADLLAGVRNSAAAFCNPGRFALPSAG
ncbi:FAD-dependent oxidoreductase [bacterium]|nr:FAD-dependent oxidoreductase [bacterium]